MKITVHLIANVTMPAIMTINMDVHLNESTEDILEHIFCIGNDPDELDKIDGNREFPSISCGDVIEFDGKFWLVRSVGFEEITKENLQILKNLPLRDRCVFGLMGTFPV